MDSIHGSPAPLKWTSDQAAAEAANSWSARCILLAAASADCVFAARYPTHSAHRVEAGRRQFVFV